MKRWPAHAYLARDRSHGEEALMERWQRYARMTASVGLVATALLMTSARAAITQTVDGVQATRLECDDDNDDDDDDDDDDGRCDSVERGRAAFNDRKLKRLGGNGRACADCHMPSEHFQLSPAAAKARFDALQAKRAHDEDADDPLFRPVDADDFRVNGDNASDFSNLVRPVPSTRR